MNATSIGYQDGRAGVAAGELLASIFGVWIFNFVVMCLWAPGLFSSYDMTPKYFEVQVYFIFSVHRYDELILRI